MVFICKVSLKIKTKAYFLFFLTLLNTSYGFNLSRIGFKLRLGSILANHEVKGSGLHLSANSVRPRLRFPLLPVFRPRYGKYTYRKVFFNYEFPLRSLNQIAQKGHEREEIESTFLRDVEREFTNMHPNWDVTSDIQTFSVAIGPQWGLFLPFRNGMRILKLGVGPVLGLSLIHI